MVDEKSPIKLSDNQSIESIFTESYIDSSNEENEVIVKDSLKKVVKTPNVRIPQK